MKLLKLMVLSLSSLVLLVTSLVVESSSLTNGDSMSNITRGSSLSSLSDTRPYWLSPSGKIAFGFYQLPWSPGRYIVGIWFVKSSQKTLVWTANWNDLPLHKPSSILFTAQGKLVLRIIPDNIDRQLLLPDVTQPAAYAKMHDNGNFVLYGSDSQIVWQSFDYPTDTILKGQKLRPGVDLITDRYRLSVEQTTGLVTIYEKTNAPVKGADHVIFTEYVSVMSDALHEVSQSKPVILSLDITGKLYLATYYDNQVVKVFYQGKQRQQAKEEEGDYMYRATLSSVGRLNLHKERIDGKKSNDSHEYDNDQESSSIVWSSSPKTHINNVKVMLAPTIMMSLLTGITSLLLGLLR